MGDSSGIEGPVEDAAVNERILADLRPWLVYEPLASISGMKEARDALFEISQSGHENLSRLRKEFPDLLVEGGSRENEVRDRSTGEELLRQGKSVKDAFERLEVYLEYCRDFYSWSSDALEERGEEAAAELFGEMAEDRDRYVSLCREILNDPSVLSASHREVA